MRERERERKREREREKEREEREGENKRFMCLKKDTNTDHKLSAIWRLN